MPGAFEDLYATFKKMPMWGRIAVGVVTLGVIIFAIYIGHQRAAAAAAQNSTTLNPGSAMPFSPASQFGGTPSLTTSSGYSTVPGANGSNVPVWNSTMQPIFDAMGNLIGWEPPPPPAPPPPPGGGGGGGGSQGQQTLSQFLPQSWVNFLYGNGGNPGGTTPNGAGLLGQGATITGGADGRIWYTPQGGTQQLLNPLLLPGGKVISGGSGRFWEIFPNGQEVLLTSGSGGNVNEVNTGNYNSQAGIP